MSMRRRLNRLEQRINTALPGPVKIGGGVLYLYSTAQSDRFDSLADHSVWDRWGDLSIGCLLCTQLGGLALVVLGAWIGLTQAEATALNAPENTVAVPGLNDFMPLSATVYVVAALIIATVVHEGGHAIACRRAGIPIQEWGVAFLFGLIPIAAYVLPEESLDESTRRIRLRVFSVGVMNNLVVALLAFVVLLLPWTASPMEAFMTYFGWAARSGTAPTAETVTALGILSNLAFWTALLSANVGLLNALPVVIFDGGRVLSLSLAIGTEAFGLPLSDRVRRIIVHLLGMGTILGVVVAILGPHLF